MVLLPRQPVAGSVPVRSRTCSRSHERGFTMKQGSRSQPGRTRIGSALRHGGPAGRGRRVLLASAVAAAGTLSSIVLLAAPAGANTSTSTTTQVSATSVTLGPIGSVHDTATVQGSATHGSP